MPVLNLRRIYRPFGKKNPGFAEHSQKILLTLLKIAPVTNNCFHIINSNGNIFGGKEMQETTSKMT